MIVAVLATGPSMSQDVANRVRGLRTVAVSDAYRLAPWAEAVCASDSMWWTNNPDALQHSGEKYCRTPEFSVPRGTKNMLSELRSTRQAAPNSGLLGLHVALKWNPSVVVLLGFNMKGEHFFGRHKSPLTNSDDNAFKRMIEQFRCYDTKGVKVINCTPNSALNCFPKDTLENVLADHTIGA